MKNLKKKLMKKKSAKRYEEISKFTNQLIEKINYNLEKFNYNVIIANFMKHIIFLIKIR